MSEIICSRKFGVTRIKINKLGHIHIRNTFNSYNGIIYSHRIEGFKAGILNPLTGQPRQVIGMDNQPAKTHIAYIHSRIQAGLFDHLIPTKEDNKP